MGMAAHNAETVSVFDHSKKSKALVAFCTASVVDVVEKTSGEV